MSVNRKHGEDAMKNSIFVTLVSACFATPALAQSGVEIYGVADAGLIWQRGGPTKIVSGGEEGSRLGFKGREDMGRGFKAVFDLEARVEIDTGTQQPTLVNDNQGFYLTRNMQALPAPILSAVRTAIQPPGMVAVNPERALFDRTAMVGMVTPFGALLLGRMYTPGYEVFAAADAFEVGGLGTWGSIAYGAGGFTALGIDIRSQKAAQYRFALPNGLAGSLMAAGRGSGYYGRYNKFFGAALTYKGHGWDVGLGQNYAYDQADSPSLHTTTLGGSYAWGDWKFFAGWHRQRNPNSALVPDYINGWDTLIAPRLAPLGAAAASALRTVFVNNIRINAQVNADAAHFGLQFRYGPGRVKAGVSYQNDHTVSNSDAILYALGYDYFQSRRTNLYAAVAFISNRGEAQYSPSLGGAPGGFTPSPGEDGRALLVGVRHQF
jgi:predicted porin